LLSSPIKNQPLRVPKNRLPLYGAVQNRFRFVSVWILGLFSLNSAGQSGFTVLNTGGGAPTVTDARQFVFSSQAGARLRVDFGFTTDESPGAAGFHDSFSATLQTLDQASTAIFFTIDIFGAQWAPSTPGTVSLDGNSIARDVISFPGGQAQLGQSVAYSVNAAIPESFLGKTVNLYFDLFDNVDGVNSKAVVGPVTIVPEPGGLSLLALGAVALASKKAWRREKA
jgi:hypothetical protein